MCSPSNSQSRPHAVNTQRERRSGRKKRHGTKSACTALHLQKTPPTAQAGKNENAPLRRSNAPTERTCLLIIPKLRTAKLVQQKQGKKLRHHKGVTVCLRIDLASHRTLHDNVSRSMRFSAQRQRMSYFTCATFANDW